MNILLYISNWKLNDGLTQSTIIPNLKILSEGSRWDRIIFTSLEFDSVAPVFINKKIIHKPFCKSESIIKLFDRIFRWQQYQSFLQQIIAENGIKNIIARGAPAGIIACKLAKKNNLQFYVESFEPHADYMAESGVWKKWDPRYLVQKSGEQKIIDNADGILAVSNNYRQKLLEKGVESSKLQMVPCTVDTSIFKFSIVDRDSIRKRYNISENALVGINVGKYGGIYHNDQAFNLFKHIFDNIPDYYQFFITPEPSIVTQQLSQYHIPAERCIVLSVKYNEVPQFLSAADFGFVLVKSTPSKKYCSAIKTGEYWACGLPIIITENIGDESEIIRSTNSGIVWDASASSISHLIEKLLKLLEQPDLKKKNENLANVYRNQSFIKDSYKSLELI